MSSDRLRVLLATTFFPPYNFGGDGYYVQRLAGALARSGCDVTVLHDVDAYKTLAPADKRNAPPPPDNGEYEVIGLRSGFGGLSSLLTQQLGSPVLTRGRIGEVLSRGFDVAHYHNVSLLGGPGLLSMGDPGVRLYTAHEHWLVCPTHVLWRNKTELCAKRTCVSCQIKHGRPPQLWRFTDHLDRHAKSVDAFIALSQSSADNHRRFGFGHDMQVMPSFLPDAAPAPAPAQADSRPHALFVGRLERIKGLDDVLAAFPNGSRVRLLIAGDGPHEDELRRIAGGSDAIAFLGRLQPDELNGYYAGALAVLTPSVCYEVFPLVALEAFRAGTPILARNLGPYPEIVRASQGGLLFERPLDVARLLNQLADDPALRANLGKAARRAFENEWSEAASLSRYFDLIAKCAKAKGLDRLQTQAQQTAVNLRARLGDGAHPANQASKARRSA